MTRMLTDKTLHEIHIADLSNDPEATAVIDCEGCDAVVIAVHYSAITDVADTVVATLSQGDLAAGTDQVDYAGGFTAKPQAEPGNPNQTIIFEVIPSHRYLQLTFVNGTVGTATIHVIKCNCRHVPQGTLYRPTADGLLIQTANCMEPCPAE